MHLVYLDSKEAEYQNLLQGNKSYLIRGATGRKLPYGRISQGDVVYLIENNSQGLVKATAVVKSIIETDKLEKADSIKLVDQYLPQLQIQKGSKFYQRFAGKRYLVLIELVNFKEISPFKFARDRFGNMDDWIIFNTLDEIKAS